MPLAPVSQPFSPSRLSPAGPEVPPVVTPGFFNRQLSPSPPSPQLTRVEAPLPPWPPSAFGDLKNVDVALADGIHVHVPVMRADFFPTTPPALPNLGRPESYLVNMRSGELLLSAQELEWAIRKSLRQSDAPLTNFRLRIQPGNELEMRATYHWGPFSIPFTFRGVMQVSADHRILFQPAGLEAGWLSWLIPLFRSTINNELKSLGIHLGDGWATLDPVRLLGMLGTMNLSGMENLTKIGTGNGTLAFGLGLGRPILEDGGYRPGNNYLHLYGPGTAVDGIALYGFDLTARDPANVDLVLGGNGPPPTMDVRFGRVQGLDITDREMTLLFGKGADPSGPLQNVQVVSQPGGLWLGATRKGTPVSLSGPVQVTPDGKPVLKPVTLTYGPWRLQGRLAAFLAGKMVNGLQAYEDGLALDLRTLLGLNLPPIARIVPGYGRLFLQFAGNGIVPDPVGSPQWAVGSMP